MSGKTPGRKMTTLPQIGEEDGKENIALKSNSKLMGGNKVDDDLEGAPLDV
jgi:hypothetical protein